LSTHFVSDITIWCFQDYGLHSTLSEFRCEKKCPYNDGAHPVSSRAHGNNFNAAAIPDALAEEVAEYVNAKFVLDRIRYTKMPLVPLTEDDANTITSSEGTAVVGDPGGTAHQLLETQG
jgi:hypothetical protein